MNDETEDQDMEKKAKIVSLLSGKGGVGKTSICLAMGIILSHLNKKVLLVDFDIATHGMTYFILDKINKENSGIIELLKNPKTNLEIVSYKSNFHILPSTTKLKTSDIMIIKDSYEEFFMPVKEIITNFSNEYDYILIDCQAGVANTVGIAIEISNKVVFVSEADPVSVWAIKNVEYEFGKILPDETFGIINKLFLEEKDRYKDIVEFSRLMKYLPPLPFDMEVRRKFARRLIPADLENPTEFIISLCYATGDLLPEMEKDINGYLKSIKVSKTHDLEEDLIIIESDLDSIREGMANVQLRGVYEKERISKMTALAIASFGLLLSTTILFKFVFNIYFSYEWLLIIGGVLLAGIAQLYILNFNRRRRKAFLINRDIKKSQEEYESLTEKKKRLEILLMDRKKPFL